MDGQVAVELWAFELKLCYKKSFAATGICISLLKTLWKKNWVVVRRGKKKYVRTRPDVNWTWTSVQFNVQGVG